MEASNYLNCFTKYDVRGRLGDEFNEDIAYRIGRAAVQLLGAKTVVVGFDSRATSHSLSQAVSKGICDAGAQVLNIGFAGTEQMYFSVAFFEACAGVEITASHNPIEYNGMKIVKKGSQPLTEEELADIKLMAELNTFKLAEENKLVVEKKTEAHEAYLQKILSFVDVESLAPLKIVINSGNGSAGPVIDSLKCKLDKIGVETNFLLVHHHPDPSFPNGIPNPILKHNQSSTSNVVKREGADFGVAFDGDFDRCFLFDNFGNFIPGEYLIGILAKNFLFKEKGATIIHDRRVVWNALDVIQRFNGNAVSSKTGHAFFKAAMRENIAIYGGEMSGHHYFRDFDFCDSGMIPWLLVWEILSKNESHISDLIYEQKHRFPSSGEINFKVANIKNCMKLVKRAFFRDAILVDEEDGLSISFDQWRFNLRGSNTEPVVRLNVEAKKDKLLLETKIEALRKIIIDS